MDSSKMSQGMKELMTSSKIVTRRSEVFSKFSEVEEELKALEEITADVTGQRDLARVHKMDVIAHLIERLKRV